MDGPDARGSEEVDTAISAWRQGDCHLQESDFAFIANGSETGRAGGTEVGRRGEVQTTRVPGLVVVTQTCDIVRSRVHRPFVEVAPLQRVATPILEEVRRFRRPRFALVPGVAEAHYVADLDRTMTVEKTVLARWSRTMGCRSDDETRKFQAALARKRQRFAFPDDFTTFASGLHRKLAERHDKRTEEGKALRTLLEIRVRAAPSWESQDVELRFWFIHDEAQLDFSGTPWNRFLGPWLDLVKPSGRFSDVDGIVVGLEDMNAKDYLESDRLDLDRLSRNSN